MLSIGELSRKTGVKIPTIRYYEQMKLIAAPERSSGNQRRYSKTELDRLGFIKHARDLGLKIEDIRELLTLAAHPEQPCAQANQIAANHLGSVRAKIAQLQRLEAELARMAEGCSSGKIENCYVIESLSNHALCSESH
ncbi:MAG: helix-turn-helix domain-containing protein [Rhodobacteraceae bacterium]|nr:helix-turn-helix domain-containing protein [Paracoccaceae bacterium]